ncbi:MAG: hypothetical protein ACXQTU_02470 [Candidatus Nezhaarchaeales archaeon]
MPILPNLLLTPFKGGPMGRSYLIIGPGNKPLLKSLELSGGNAIIVTDKPLDFKGLIEVLDIFKQFSFLASIPSSLSSNDNLILDLYAHALRLSAMSRYASMKTYLRLCEVLTASAKAKCFNLYISYCGEKDSWPYKRLKTIIDEEVMC